MNAMQPVPTSFSNRLDDFRRGPFTFLVWLVAAGAAVWIYMHSQGQSHFVGLATGTGYTVSAPGDNQILRVPVGVGDQVKAGQIIVQMDDSLLQAQIETARAALDQAKAEVEATRHEEARSQGKAVSDWQSNLSQIQREQERLKLEASKLQMALETDRLEKSRLEAEVARADQLVQSGSGSRGHRDALKVQLDQTVKRLEENGRMLSSVEKSQAEFKRQSEEVSKLSPESADSQSVILPREATIRMQEQLLQELEVKRRHLSLRAPVDGVVTQVLCQPGQAVKSDMPIMTISQNSASEIVAYVPEEDLTQVKANQQVLISRRMAPREIVMATVAKVNPAIEMLPARIWHDPKLPVYGRSFVITPPADLKLTPGEQVMVRLAH